jgi:hypothetical protein
MNELIHHDADDSTPRNTKYLTRHARHASITKIASDFSF